MMKVDKKHKEKNPVILQPLTQKDKRALRNYQKDMASIENDEKKESPTFPTHLPPIRNPKNQGSRLKPILIKPKVETQKPEESIISKESNEVQKADDSKEWGGWEPMTFEEFQNALKSYHPLMGISVQAKKKPTNDF